jgi:uncharacterized membrane protein
MSKTKRDSSIDRLRGIAILCMLYAHLVPYYVENGTKLLFIERVFSSLAAPLFLFLVGYNFNIRQNFNRIFKRTLLIFILATGIDVFVWGIYPFYSFDVLYLIAISVFILYFIRNFNHTKLLILVFLIVIVSVCITYFKIYSVDLYEPYLNQSYKLNQVFYNFFINGWFPIFPWIIFPILGLIMKSISIESKNNKIISILLFTPIISLIFLSKFNWRPFSVEIFYPASFIYLLLALSYLYLVQANKSFLRNRIFSFLDYFGKLSLFLYLLHLSIYKLLGNYLIDFVENRVYCFGIFILFFLIVAYIFDKLKKRFVIFQKSEYLQFIFGN